MIALRDLVQRLARRKVPAWTVFERVQDIATVDERHAIERHEHRARLTLTLHDDQPRGRGSARIELDSHARDLTADGILDHALAIARANLGPAWVAAPPAAPAKVALADPALLQRELDAAARNTLLALRRPVGVAVSARLQLCRDKCAIAASSGFHLSWPETSIQADAWLRASPGSPDKQSVGAQLHIIRSARRIDDLALDAALAEAADDLALLATANDEQVPAGLCALCLGPDALLHGGGLGIWQIFAELADAATERQGLQPFRLRTELAPGAAQRAEPLAIHSDGALDFAPRSAPVSDEAIAVRRFPLVEGGVAVGLALDAREAALRQTAPNAGIANLVVALGTWPGLDASPSVPAAMQLRPTRVIEVRRLRALDLDPRTAIATLDLALGIEHRPGAAPTPFTGGTIHLELLPALALAQRSARSLHRGAYRGPASILVPVAHLRT